MLPDENGRMQRISLNGATICCGTGQPSYDRLIESMGCKGICYPSSSTKGLPDSENPMQPINDFHGSIKSFLRAHRSFERKNLQDCLNLFCFFWNTPGTNERKVVILTDKVVSERQIIRYRGKKKLSSSEKRKNA